MTRESDMLYEAAGHYVIRQNGALIVFRPAFSGTHAFSDCAFADTADGLSCAKARCDYLAKRKAGAA
jgi:hypothetical protein